MSKRRKHKQRKQNNRELPEPIPGFEQNLNEISAKVITAVMKEMQDGHHRLMDRVAESALQRIKLEIRLAIPEIPEEAIVDMVFHSVMFRIYLALAGICENTAAAIAERVANIDVPIDGIDQAAPVERYAV